MAITRSQTSPFKSVQDKNHPTSAPTVAHEDLSPIILGTVLQECTTTFFNIENIFGSDVQYHHQAALKISGKVHPRI